MGEFVRKNIQYMGLFIALISVCTITWADGGSISLDSAQMPQLKPPAKKTVSSKAPQKANVKKVAKKVRAKAKAPVATTTSKPMMSPVSAAPAVTPKPLPVIAPSAPSQDLTGLKVGQIHGQKISIDLRDADIRNVLNFISESSGYNIVAGDGIKGTVTIRLRDVHWRDALHAILQVKGLGYIETAGIIRVMPLQELQQERATQIATVQLAEQSMPMVTRIMPLDYADANILIPQFKSILTSRGNISFDERTNVLVVTDISSVVDRMEQLIAQLDKKTPQVLIEARLVEVSTSFSRSLGIQWGGLVGVGQGATTQAAGKDYAVNLPASNASSAFGITLGTVGNLAVLNARLSAGEQSGQAKTVSTPKIMTLDNKPAIITQGYQIPVTVTTLNSIQTKFFNAALQLDVTPHVTSDGTVMMAVKITDNQPDFKNKDNMGIPSIQTKESFNQLLVRDGDTAVIGGIYSQKSNKVTNQTPGIGRIPVLGWLFKNTEEQQSQTELMVFLTPRIIKPAPAKAASELPILSAQ